jgi:hypothetical protein
MGRDNPGPFALLIQQQQQQSQSQSQGQSDCAISSTSFLVSYLR